MHRDDAAQPVGRDAGLRHLVEPTEGFALEINIPNCRWLHWPGIVWSARRDDSALSDRAARRPAIFLTTCGMGD